MNREEVGLGLEVLKGGRPAKVQRLSWLDLANLWGVSERSVYYWKRGQKRPRKARREMVARTFRCKVEDIWPEEGGK